MNIATAELGRNGDFPNPLVADRFTGVDLQLSPRRTSLRLPSYRRWLLAFTVAPSVTHPSKVLLPLFYFHARVGNNILYHSFPLAFALRYPNIFSTIVSISSISHSFRYFLFSFCVYIYFIQSIVYRNSYLYTCTITNSKIKSKVKEEIVNVQIFCAGT